MSAQIGSRNKNHERKSVLSAELDKRTMEAIAGGDETAFEALFSDNRKPVLNFAYGILGDAGKAEDVAQEAFVRLWKQAENWESRARVQTWLFTVVKNLCLDEKRRLGSESHAFSKILHEDRETAPGADDAYGEKESAARIDEAMHGLPQRQRLAVQLVYFSECANTEAAETMKVSVGALESLLSRGKAQLKENLAASCSLFVPEAKKDEKKRRIV